MSTTEGEFVWLSEWRTYGQLLHVGAHTSRVSFINPHTGERVEDEIENDELSPWGDHAIDYERE